MNWHPRPEPFNPYDFNAPINDGLSCDSFLWEGHGMPLQENGSYNNVNLEPWTYDAPAWPGNDVGSTNFEQPDHQQQRSGGLLTPVSSAMGFEGHTPFFQQTWTSPVSSDASSPGAAESAQPRDRSHTASCTSHDVHGQLRPDESISPAPDEKKWKTSETRRAQNTAAQRKHQQRRARELSALRKSLKTLSMEMQERNLEKRILAVVSGFLGSAEPEKVSLSTHYEKGFTDASSVYSVSEEASPSSDTPLPDNAPSMTDSPNAGLRAVRPAGMSDSEAALWRRREKDRLAAKKSRRKSGVKGDDVEALQSLERQKLRDDVDTVLQSWLAPAKYLLREVRSRGRVDLSFDPACPMTGTAATVSVTDAEGFKYTMMPSTRFWDGAADAGTMIKSYDTYE